MIKAIIFDAFGTLFQVTNGGSAKTIMSNITSNGITVDEQEFLSEWKAFYKEKTGAVSKFMTERDIFISRIQMFYERYHINRSAVQDADDLLASAYERQIYNEIPATLKELSRKHQIFIGSNTDNDVLDAVMKLNNITVDKIYTSENLSCYKPNPEFYRQILTENLLKVEEVIFVGDSLTDDIYGPGQIGIKTVLVDRNGTYSSQTNIAVMKPDIIVKDLTGLIDCRL